MAKRDSSILSIELHESEIRVIQTRTRSNQTVIEKMGRAAMPQGAMDRGTIVSSTMVSRALRSLLDSMEVTTAKAVIGISGQFTTIRTLAVPPAPDSDLAKIVLGEVEHHHLIKSPLGTHAFVRLNPQFQGEINHAWAEDSKIWLDSKNSKIRPDLVTVFAVEQETLSVLRQTIEDSGLSIEAFEPTQYAMYRSIQSSVGPATTYFAVMVGPENTDIAVIFNGQLMAYRRIDLGSRELSGDGVTSGEYAYAGTHLVAYADEPHDVVTRECALNPVLLEAFSTEIHRTLYYYQREYPNLTDCERVILAVDDSKLESLSSELGLRLGLSVECPKPFGTLLDKAISDSSFANRFEIVSCGAFGLALQGPTLMRTPRVDLFTSQREADAVVVTKRNFKGSIIASVLAIVLGFTGCLLYYKQIALMEADTRITSTEASRVRSEIDSKVQDRHRQADQYKAFRKAGIPVTAILDAIANSVSPGTGLASVYVSQSQNVVIDGESDTEASMLNTVKALQDCSLLQDLRINWFRKLPADKGSGISFEFRGKTISADRVRLPEEKNS